MKAIVSKSGRTISEARWGSDAFDGNFEAHVGRAEDCHVRVDDPLVSRHLLRVRQEGAGLVVEKANDQAEVSLNGEALRSPQPLRSGDVLRFASYQLQFDDVPRIDAEAATEVDTPLPAVDDFPEDDYGAVTSDQATDVGLTLTVPLTPSEAPASVALPDDDLSSVSDDLMTETMPMGEDVEAPASALTGHAMDDLNFGGEEDVIGSLPAEDSDPSFNPETGEVGGEATSGTDFGDALTGVEHTGMDQLPAQTDYDAGESTQVLKRFATFELHLFGEFAPYDRYVVDGSEVLIGRDAFKCQIVLMDPEVSSIHAIVRKGITHLTLEDQNSSNGTLLNGQRINKADLSHGDEFVVGSTTFTVHVSSDLLEDESDRLMPVESGQVVERIEEIEEEVPADAEAGLDFAGGEPQEKSVLKRIWKDPKKKRIAVFLIIAAMAASLLPDESDKPKPAPKTEAKTAPPVAVDPNKKVLSPEQIAALEASMRIAETYIKDKQLAAALAELEKIMLVDPEYKNVRTLHAYVKEQNAKIEEEKKRLAAEEARAKVRDQVRELLKDAKAAVDEHNVARAEKLFSEIMTLDPETIEVTPLRQELDLWLAQQKAEAEEKARKEAARRKMVDQLAPGKAHYLRKEWHRATIKLDEFLQIKLMDEDLLKEATEMLADARAQMAAEVGPLLGKARSLKEGQDLKGAYEAYLDVLRLEPTNVEALNEVDGIRGQLEARAKKIYREAIISESLSLFGDAKEKLQEVQQVSPTDSEYYKKATEKLKDYLE